MIFPKNLKALREGRPCPCWFDFKWSEITARGDWRPEPLLLRFQMKWNNSKGRLNVVGIRLNDNHLRRIIGPPLFQRIFFSEYLKMYFNRILKKGRSYVSSARGRSVCPCCYFTSFVLVTVRAMSFSLPLLLFHSIWNPIRKGKVSPPSRPLGFWEISPLL